MVPQTLVALVLAGRAFLPGGGEPSPAIPSGGAALPPITARYEAGPREVTNWRFEAVDDLQPKSLVVLAALFRAERPVVSRCVKLNNYWCIKSARWNGEVGADDEGHTGFASAEHGADAAVRLLRRYYLEFDRRSALDIVRRWAPAECRLPGSSGLPAVLALRGLGNTLRARWLAARGPKSARTRVAAADGAGPMPPRRPPGRVSTVPLRPLPTVSMPSIMAGIAAPKAPSVPAPRVTPRRQPTPASLAAAKADGRKAERAASAAGASGAARPAAKAASTAPPRPEPAATASASGLACAPDEGRIQNYAGRMVEGLDLAPGDDLGLFAPDGRPQPNLARVLLAMSAFELGYLRASVDLVEAAIERATPPAPGGERVGGAPGPAL
jgi:hypothetical protein